MNNADFLTKIFHAAQKGESGCIASVHRRGDQITFPAHPFPAWSVQKHHTHYGVGLHLPRDPAIRDKNRFKRGKDTWTGMALMVLDDVGEEKAGGEILIPDLQPTFIVETKPGSQQWGYVFDQPIRDYGDASALLKASKWANVNDPHGQNPARLVRLPGSLPPGKQHRAKLVEWHGTHFTVDQVVDGLGMDLEAAQAAQGRGQGEYQINRNGMDYATMALWPEAQEQMEDILMNLLVAPDEYHWNMNRLALALANWFGHPMPKIEAFLRAVVNVAHRSGRIDQALYDKHISKVTTMANHYAAIGDKNRAEMKANVLAVAKDASADVIEKGFMAYAEHLPDLDQGIAFLEHLKGGRG